MADILESESFWEDDELAGVYIEPPINHEQSDEDSGEEDSGGLLDNLSGRQLQARAEAVFASGRRLGNNEDFDEEDDLPLSHFIEKPVQWSWVKDGDLHVTGTIFPEKDYTRYRNMTPMQLFELFFDNAIVDFLVEESTKYAGFINCTDPKITHSEIRCFIGILIVTGYCGLPGKKLYWDTGEDMRNELIYKSMRRDRFIQIMRFLHFNDNTKLDPADKMTKLRPFINLLKTRFLEHFVPDQDISYDESMIEYYGRHGCKQFIRGKPIRFGYKVWAMNTKNGYLINFEIYQGSIPNSNPDHQKKYGKAAAPLLQLINDFPQEVKSLPFNFFFDNLFTSPKLLVFLQNKGYQATGTIRDNRIPKNCPIMPVKQMKKENRGQYDYALDKEKSVLIVRWMDNAVVTVASTVYGINPVGMASRYSMAQKKRIGIQRPNAITQYNQFMGGTDQMDANIGAYRIGIRGKKWYWPIFTYLVDVCVQNAWVIARNTGNNISQLNFRREIAQIYLKTYGTLPKAPGRPYSYSDSSRVARDLRYDKSGHLVELVPNQKRRRCAGDRCNSVGRTQCQKCQVGLCIPCFVPFHNEL